MSEYIWRSRDDGRVRALHQDRDDHIWTAPPEDRASGRLRAGNSRWLPLLGGASGRLAGRGDVPEGRGRDFSFGRIEPQETSWSGLVRAAEATVQDYGTDHFIW